MFPLVSFRGLDSSMVALASQFIKIADPGPTCWTLTVRIILTTAATDVASAMDLVIQLGQWMMMHFGSVSRN